MAPLASVGLRVQAALTGALRNHANITVDWDKVAEEEGFSNGSYAKAQFQAGIKHLRGGGSDTASTPKKRSKKDDPLRKSGGGVAKGTKKFKAGHKTVSDSDDDEDDKKSLKGKIKAEPKDLDDSDFEIA